MLYYKYRASKYHYLTHTKSESVRHYVNTYMSPTSAAVLDAVQVVVHAAVYVQGQRDVLRDSDVVGGKREPHALTVVHAGF